MNWAIAFGPSSRIRLITSSCLLSFSKICFLLNLFFVGYGLTLVRWSTGKICFFSSFKRRDWQYVGVYADEASTGTKDDRKQFQKLLADCRVGLIDMVITKSISRFARNTVTLLEAVRELKEIKVDVFFEKENIILIAGMVS